MLEYCSYSMVSDVLTLNRVNSEIDRNTVNRTKVDWIPALIQTKNYIPISDYRFYFELEIESMADENADVAIGLSARTSSLESLPGLIDLSCGYHSDGNILHNGKKDPFSQGNYYGEGDIVGCYGDLAKGLFYFTKNGFVVNEPRTNPNGRINILSDTLYPTISLKGNGTRVKSYFGNGISSFDPNGKFMRTMLIDLLPLVLKILL